MTAKQTALTTVLEGLMRRYKQRVSDVSHIISEMVAQSLIHKESDIINDHIAFRTMGVKQLGIQSLEKIFLAYGYQKRDDYHFKAKKLDANWYAPPKGSHNLPRIFISECRVQEFSKPVQKIIETYTSQVKSDPVEDLELLNGAQVDQFLHSPLWTTPTYEDYQRVLEESEYAAWVLYNRYYLNHFTITIQALNTHNDIASFNQFLESIGIQLSTAGGVIKQSQDKKLLQSASVAKKVKALFPHEDGSEQQHLIAGSYVEFAQRIKGREGFEVGNADKIFESTFTNQVDKRK